MSHQRMPSNGARLSAVVAYIYSPEDGESYTRRFVQSYTKLNAGYPHTLIVIVNAGPMPASAFNLLASLKPVWFGHNDEGWDIGAYIALAHHIDCDFIFCVGGKSYFRKPGWLARIAESWTKHGAGMHGTLASYEDRPHFCTTGFAVSPQLLRSYPFRVRSRAERYQFEHGERSLVSMCQAKKIPTMLVTWDGEWECSKWREPDNIYARGDQSNCITYFFHSDSYDTSGPQEKIRRQHLADDLKMETKQTMKIAIAYLHVVGRSDPTAPEPSHYRPWSERFIKTYRQWKDPDVQHDLIIVCCGGEITDDAKGLFPEAIGFLEYRGGGWDIGAHQHAARLLRSQYDFLICLATPCYFWRPGFLGAVVRARERFGDGLYGSSASFENLPHIRTCSWAFSPETFSRYPHTIDTREKTFRAESGDMSITRWFQSQGLPTIMVAPDGNYAETDWRKSGQGFRQGRQTNVFIRERHWDLFDAANLDEKAKLTARSDGKK